MKRPFAFAVLIAMFVCASAFAQTAELHPGTLHGTVTLSSETINSGYIYAYATDGAFSASGPIASDGTYSLLVEGGHTYRVNGISVYTGSTSISIWGNQQSVLVPVEGTGTIDLHYTTAKISASINVAGGTANAVDLRADGYENYESYQSRGWFSGAGPYLFPAAPLHSAQFRLAIGTIPAPRSRTSSACRDVRVFAKSLLRCARTVLVEIPSSAATSAGFLPFTRHAATAASDFVNP